MKEINLGGGSKLSFRGGEVSRELAAEAMSAALVAAAKYKQFLDEHPEQKVLLRLRYMFEHRGLPWLWLKDPSIFTPESIHELLAMTWVSAAKLERMEHIPEFPRIKEERLNMDGALDGAKVIVLRMPFPAAVPFCYRIALVSFGDSRKPLYLTQERALPPFASGLCCWEMKDGNPSFDNLRHGNYGCMLPRGRSEFIAKVRDVMSGVLTISCRLEVKD